MRERALLRDDQQLAVGIDEHAVAPSTWSRGRGGPRRLRGRPGRGWRASSPGRRRSPCRRAGRPADPSAGGWAPAAPRPCPGANKRRALVARERAMVGGRPHPVEPGAAVLVPRRGEGAARQLLGIEAEGRPLRRVAALGQRALRPPRFRNGRRSRSCSSASSCAPVTASARAQSNGRGPMRNRARAPDGDSQPARSDPSTVSCG